MLARFWPIGLVAIAVTAVTVGSLYYLGSASGSGMLDVKVHDAPCNDCTHVWVTFSSVAVHEANGTGSGWTTLNVSGQTLDLMTLNGSGLAKTIALGSLKAGQYEQIRLSVTQVVVGFANGTNVNASIPSASSADVHGAFNVTPGATTTLSIDVDLASSLHVVGAGPNVRATFTPNLGAIVVV